MDCRPDTALVIVGHGAATNPDSSRPTRVIADVLRSRGIFNEVLCCFWKEAPAIRGILDAVSSPHVYVVPNFISEGYFTRTVIPRELGLNSQEGHTTRVTTRGGQTIRYCEPVGTHPSMTTLLLQRAREIAPDIPPAKTSLLIVGHGTGLNAHSAQAARKQASLISALGLYAEVLSSYMEEPPFIGDWANMTTQQHVVVLPYFISDGLHSTQDIPLLLGITQMAEQAAGQSDVFNNNPHLLHGKKLFYGSAIGTASTMSEVILDQILSFDVSQLGESSL